MPTATVDVQELPTRWRELLSLATAGTEIIVMEANIPRARLVLLSLGQSRVAGPHAGALAAPIAVPEGVQRSREAFLKDLTQLLESKRWQGQWVAYHGEERIGFARTQAELDQRCLQRGLPLNEFFVGWIGPQMTEEIDGEELLDL